MAAKQFSGVLRTYIAVLFLNCKPSVWFPIIPSLLPQTDIFPMQLKRHFWSLDFNFRNVPLWNRKIMISKPEVRENSSKQLQHWDNLLGDMFRTLDRKIILRLKKIKELESVKFSQQTWYSICDTVHVHFRSGNCELCEISTTLVNNSMRRLGHRAQK